MTPGDTVDTTPTLTSSPTIGALAAALAKAQGAMRAAAKDAENPHFRSKYADLASVLDACREPLAANGLAVIQLPEDAGPGRVAIRTVLAHASGEYVATVVSAPLGQQTAQAIGSALTYLRRYSLSAVVGVAPDDDDGEAAMGRAAATAPLGGRASPRAKREKRDDEPPETPSRRHDPSWDADRGRFCGWLGTIGVEYDDLAAWREAVGKVRPSALTQPQRDALRAWLPGHVDDMHAWLRQQRSS